MIVILVTDYFIPEINMLENKTEGHERQVLLRRLNVLYSYEWRCILMSKQFSEYRVSAHIRVFYFYYDHQQIFVELNYYISTT
jgi:hypothetical protein